MHACRHGLRIPCARCVTAVMHACKSSHPPVLHCDQCAVRATTTSPPRSLSHCRDGGLLDCTLGYACTLACAISSRTPLIVNQACEHIREDVKHMLAGSLGEQKRRQVGAVEGVPADQYEVPKPARRQVLSHFYDYRMHSQTSAEELPP